MVYNLQIWVEFATRRLILKLRVPILLGRMSRFESY